MPGGRLPFVTRQDGLGNTADSFPGDINGFMLTLSVPIEKRMKACGLLEHMVGKHKATVQELCRFLNFWNRAVFPGRAFTCCMYSKFSNILHTAKVQDHGPAVKVLKPHHHVHLGHEFKLDCEVRLTFLNLDSDKVVNRPMVELSGEPLQSKEVNFFSDASANRLLGFGCIFKNHWIWSR